MADQAYSFAVLGPLLVQRDGESLSIASGHQRTLLALLLAAEQPLSRDRLIDELWGESPPATAGKALSVFLSRLRAQLGDVITFADGAYRLEAGDYAIDAARFRELLARARAANEPAVRRGLLADALALFRGEPLVDVDSDGLIARWRRALQQERLDAIVARVDCDLEQGQGSELVVELEGLLDGHPYEERVWAQLMVALARSGRQADALEAHQRVRRLFSYELGIEPGAALGRVQAAILAGGDGWGSPVPAEVSAAEPAAARPDSPRAGVPRPLGAFIGREAELAELNGRVAEPEFRLVTLIGGGGFGKTRLALELAHRVEREFNDGAVFVDLGQLGDPELVLTEIAAALGARDGSPPPPVTGLGNALAGRELLLLLDNFEHLLPAAGPVADLLIAAPGVTVIATSRAPLRVRGEFLFEVEPLELPDGDDAAALIASPAVGLFIDRGRAIDRHLSTDHESIRLIAAVCRRLDALPLGIELAAAQLRLLTLEQLERSLEPLSLGASGPRDLPERQHTLERTIAWSFDMLTPEARELLLAASVFRGGFTRDALAEVVGSSPDAALAELLDSSLVRREHDAPRFAMLELVRAFARAELAGAPQELELRARHRGHFARIADAVGAELHDGDPRTELAEQLRPDSANLRAALEDSFVAGDRDNALGLVRGMRALWYTGWLVYEGQLQIDRLLTDFEVEPADELLLLRSGSFLEGVTPERETRGVWTERLAQRAEELGDLPALSIAVANLASMAHNTHDRDAVLALKPRLLELTTADIPPRHRAFIFYTLAASCYLEGDLAAACAASSESVRLAAEADHAYLLGACQLLDVMVRALRDGVMHRSGLAEGLASMMRSPIRPLAPFALWLLARYSVSLDGVAAIRWLSEAERIYTGLEAEMWPESDVRDETMRELGLEQIPPADSPVVDYLVTLQSAIDWLAARPDGEVSQL